MTRTISCLVLIVMIQPALGGPQFLPSPQPVLEKKESPPRAVEDPAHRILFPPEPFPPPAPSLLDPRTGAWQQVQPGGWGPMEGVPGVVGNIHGTTPKSSAARFLLHRWLGIPSPGAAALGLSPGKHPQSWSSDAEVPEH
jgi:hypothetical protein